MNNTTQKKQDEKIEVIFRKSVPIDDPESNYPGFQPGTTTLSKGSTQRKGGLSLPCDIIFERDVAVKMRENITIYIDIYRPTDSEKVPAIVAWSPYGKKDGPRSLDKFPGRLGIPVNALSGLEAWEAPDPAYWCDQGYAIVVPDARGAFMSEGDIHFWGTQEAHDGYDLIEWLAVQEWCNGRVGLSGNSWLAIIQWFIASTRPPHLAAIAPWEGLSDMYRHDICRGGIPNCGFNEHILYHLYGKNRTEDVPGMLEKYPLMNSYWEDKSAKLEKIDVPAYVVASYTNPLHVHGTLEGFRRISSKEKWLRIHNTQEWVDYYDPKYREELKSFFDCYLKEEDNNWKNTPKVRISVLDPGGTDEVDRVEGSFPPERVQYRKFFLDADTGKLSKDPIEPESKVQYNAEDGKGKATFSISFDRETEIIGYPKLRLWVEAKGSNDMDLFVLLQKLSRRGKQLSGMVISLPNNLMKGIPNSMEIFKSGSLFYTGPNGRLRVSRRQLDEKRSTPSQPFHTHVIEELLKPGEIVPVEIPIFPVGMRWHKGEQLRVTVEDHNPAGPMLPGIPPESTRNSGEHIIHTGGEFDSHLLLPLIEL